ncbi:MAG: hypothetical protein M3Y85_08025 [Bacteroidota bacterium]|nr:hypothetical protein [Bacteroidota bacterium]
MSIEQIIDVPENGQLTIHLPSSLKNSKRVKIIINDIDESLDAKIALLKNAADDKDFLADLEEVNKDFEAIESRID